MTQDVILASSSEIRRKLLGNAGVPIDVKPARIDEDMVRDALLSESAKPRNIADALAELKSRKVSDKYPNALVIGCDQILALEGSVLAKPDSKHRARDQLAAMRGKQHDLLSAVVICEAGQPVWRHVGHVRMTVRSFSEPYLDDYVDRNWDSIRHSVGAYKLEEEGVRLFSKIEGDYFTVLGLPLLELLSYLGLRGVIEQ